MNKAINPAVVVAIVVLILGVVAGAGFYQDEVRGFVRLQGWNTRPVADATREFVEAAAKGDGASVAKWVASEPQNMELERKGDAVAAFMVQDYGGMKRQTLRQLCPSPDPRISAPRLVYLNGGTVVVEVAYPKSHTLQLSWDRKPEGWKLVTIGRAG